MSAMTGGRLRMNRMAATVWRVALSCGLSVLVWLFTSSSTAFAQTPPMAEGWEVKCSAEKRCEMQSRYLVENAVAGRLIIYTVGTQPIVEYLLPLRINLLKGVILFVDEKQRFATQPLYCDAPGCVGFAPLTTELLAALRRGGKVELVFTMQGDGRTFAFPFSLIGFAKCHEAWRAGDPTAPINARP